LLILTWNEAEDVADLMASIGDQRVDEFEVVVVDADSDDGTIEAVQAAAERLDVPVRLEVADRHLSIGEARNRAVGLAQAPVVAFGSADVELDERVTERALASIEEADMVFSRQVHDPRSWSLGAAVRGLRYHHFPTEPTDDPLRYASHVAAVYRREIPERFPFDPDVVAVDDLLLADRARRAGYEPAYDPDMVVYHHDVADAEGELAKSVREARGWGLYVDELGPMTPVIAWGLALVAAIGLLFTPGSLVPTSTGVELAVLAGVLWAPTLRRVARQAGAMPAGPLAFATVASPVFDLVFLFNYARGLLEAKGSPTASTPEGIEP
jgi:glycosyltransferase involved in cell wall biosynthesis